MDDEAFLARLDTSRDEHDIAACVFDYARDIAPHLGVYLPTADGKSFNLHTYNVPAKAIDDYEKHLRDEDPAVRQASHTLTATAISARAWHLHDAHYRTLVEPYIHLIDEYMVAPIVVGRGVGTIQLARRGSRFSVEDLRRANLIGMHTSIRLGVLRADERALGDAWRGVLTDRALDVAALAVAGSTNAEIGTELGVSVNTVKKHLKKVFDDVGVSSRAELGRALMRGPPRGHASRRTRTLKSGRVFIW